MVMTALAPVAPGARIASLRSGGIVPLPPRSAAACPAPHSSPAAAKRSVFAHAEHQEVCHCKPAMKSCSTFWAAFEPCGFRPALQPAAVPACQHGLGDTELARSWVHEAMLSWWLTCCLTRLCVCVVMCRGPMQWTASLAVEQQQFP